MAGAPEAIRDVFTKILEPQSSPMSKFLGLLMACLMYYVLGIVIQPYPYSREVAYWRRQAIVVLNGFVLTAGYLYCWSQSNPHSAVPLDNNPAFEIPLMLTGGYYLLDMFSGISFFDIGHHAVSVISLMELLMEGKAANIGVAFAFMVEIANVVYVLRNVAMKCETECAIFFKILYPVVFILVRFVALMHLSLNIVNNKDLPEVPKSLAVLLFFCSFVFCFRMVGHLFEEPGPKKLERNSSTRKDRRSKRRSSSRKLRRSLGRSKTRYRTQSRSRSSRMCTCLE